MDKYRTRICQLFTNIMYEKLIDIIKNAKINEQGVKVLKADFQKIFKTFAERLDEFYYAQLHNIVYLVEIFTTPREAIDTFLDTLKGDKYDPELLKILVKKRNSLKI
jgi:hypothetical protein